MLPAPFARALSARMPRRQVNVTELAAATAVSRGSAARWLTGAHPRARALTAITKVLGDPCRQMHRAWQQHQGLRPGGQSRFGGCQLRELHPDHVPLSLTFTLRTSSAPYKAGTMRRTSCPALVRRRSVSTSTSDPRYFDAAFVLYYLYPYRP